MSFVLPQTETSSAPLNELDPLSLAYVAHMHAFWTDSIDRGPAREMFKAAAAVRRASIMALNGERLPTHDRAFRAAVSNAAQTYRDLGTYFEAPEIQAQFKEHVEASNARDWLDSTVPYTLQLAAAHIDALPQAFKAVADALDAEHAAKKDETPDQKIRTVMDFFTREMSGPEQENVTKVGAAR